MTHTPPVAPTPSVVAAPSPAPISRAPLSESLAQPVKDTSLKAVLSEGPMTIFVVNSGDKGIKTVIKGPWSGRLLTGAIRSIEREYKLIKYTITREAARARMAAVATNQEAK